MLLPPHQRLGEAVLQSPTPDSNRHALLLQGVGLVLLEAVDESDCHLTVLYEADQARAC